MAIQLNNILSNNRAMILAFDQGLEHGPHIFDQNTIDPEHVLNIALEGHYSGLVMHAGLAEKHYMEAYRDIPLIVKLNGKSKLSHMNPLSTQMCSVDHAVKIGADAVGYTIYDGSPAEPEMFKEFGKIVEQAHAYGLPVVAWMYPRGPSIHGHETDTDTIAYAARIGQELGADFVKLKYNGDAAGFNWVCKSAGRSKVLMSDTDFQSNEDTLRQVSDAVKAGATGVAFGRTIWQHPRPFSLTRALHGVVMHDKSPEEVLSYFE